MRESSIGRSGANVERLATPGVASPAPIRWRACRPSRRTHQKLKECREAGSCLVKVIATLSGTWSSGTKTARGRRHHADRTLQQRIGTDIKRLRDRPVRRHIVQRSSFTAVRRPMSARSASTPDISADTARRSGRQRSAGAAPALEKRCARQLAERVAHGYPGDAIMRQASFRWEFSSKCEGAARIRSRRMR